MRWVPDKIWDGLECFIIGGGRSLKEGFDFDKLIGEKTIGCNDAYKLGPKICNICIFGDKKWLDVHKNYLNAYIKSGGIVVTNERHLETSPIEWLKWIPRENKGLHKDALGWNTNTGASAINLALILGAKTVYLLGFDRHLTDGKPNWHDDIIDKPRTDTYPRMNSLDYNMKKDLASKFPGCQVINVTDNSSLALWPKISFNKFWEERR